ncbi:MAG: heavy metal translocating P-type ATPase [Lachnospirales bacterium]
MRYSVTHRLKGRIRVYFGRYTFNKKTAHAMNEYVKAQNGVLSAITSYRTGSVLINYEDINENEILALFSKLNFQELLEYDKTAVIENSTEEFVVTLSKKVIIGTMLMPLVPRPISYILMLRNAFGYVKKAAKSIVKNKKITVDVLDSVAIVTSITQGNTGTAKSIMLLLAISDLIEHWTIKKSKSDLARFLEINIDKVWIKTDDSEIEIPLSHVKKGDKVIIRTGSIIPVDGTIVEGEASINQSTMTGEPLPVRKGIEDYVYAGTVVEDGNIVIETMETSGNTRLSKIIELVDESELNKSVIQKQTENLADKIVPISLLSALGTFILTRNVMKATAFLLVDYSCAIKLSGSLSVLGAIQEASKHKLFVKGGKYLEKIAVADTIIFDKTGTLTYATPKIKNILTFDVYDYNEVLKLSACLEEHFPHPIARAVVAKAEEENLNHKEEHDEVEYIIAHGVASKLNGKRVLIGSRHFIFEDEKVSASKEDLDKIEKAITTESSLFLAIDGKLAGVLLIEDPIREDAINTIKALHKVGLKVAMLTGDSESAAGAVAKKLGIDEYKSQLLPEDKATYIQKLKSEGRTIVMVGDGVNDTPALAVADVGIAMKSGSDIAREVADITMLTSDINQLVTLRIISERLIKRVKRNYGFIISFNSLLIGLSLFQVITPGTSSYLHNLSTIGVSASSLRPVLIEKDKNKD